MSRLDEEERMVRKMMAMSDFLRAQSLGKVTKHPFHAHRKGCDCGHCDGSGVEPGGGVTMYSWPMNREE